MLPPKRRGGWSRLKKGNAKGAADILGDDDDDEWAQACEPYANLNLDPYPDPDSGPILNR